MGKESYFRVVQEIRFGAPRAVQVLRVPQQGLGGFPGQGWRELPELCVGGGTGAQFPTFLAGGMEFIHFVPSWGVWRCCWGVSALQQACSCCCLPFPVVIFLVLHCSHTKPTVLISFSPQISLLKKHPFCCLAGKKKLGLCRAQRRKMVMVTSSKPHLCLLLPWTPSPSTFLFHLHLQSRWIKHIKTNQYCPEAKNAFSWAHPLPSRALSSRMNVLLAQLTGTHWPPASHTTGVRQCSCSQTDSPATDIYGYIWIFIFFLYIYISQEKLYVQQLGFIRASLAFTGTDGEAQSRAVTSSRAKIKYFLDGKCHVCHQKDVILIMSLSVHTPQSLCTGHTQHCPRVPVPFRGTHLTQEHVAFLKSLMLGQIPKLSLLLLFSSCAVLEITIPHSGL